MLAAGLNLLIANSALVVVLLILAFLTIACSQNPHERKGASESTLRQESAETTGMDPASGDPSPDDSDPAVTATDDGHTDLTAGGRARGPSADRFAGPRAEMIDQHLAARDITDPRVLDAMRRVPRHEFVPDGARRQAYADAPLPIGHGQTISQPYIVALMTQLVDPQPTAKALDVGTGSGYQAAVLAELVQSVYSIEIVEPLAEEAQERLQSLGYENVHVRHGDGYRGWPEEAPFDIIIVAAAPDHVPQPLVDQLAPGGKMVIPVGRYFQNLLVLEKDAGGTVSQRKVAPVAFVPMTGEAQK